MSDRDSLNVWFEDHLVGRIWRNPTGAIAFRYESAWLKSGGFPISRSLPPAQSKHTSADNLAHRFFANLLPEGGAREQIVQDLKIPNTDFDLLRATGGECAGALSILPAEREPGDVGEYRPLSSGELSELILRRGRIHAALPEQLRPRLALAGAQTKCPVLLREGQYLLPCDAAPTSHILKFDLLNYRNVPAYEIFVTLLARQIGLPTVESELLGSWRRVFSRSTRYDRRQGENGHLRRLHQEDFCQALGYGHEKKYQEYGGPTFADCVRLLREVSTDPAVDVRHLLRWQIFNVLVGNSDGHAKNLALLRGENGEFRLAPFYDLVCTRAMARVDYHLAFAVGGERHPGMLTVEHWRSFAEDCDIGARFLRGLLEQSASTILERLDETKALFTARYGENPALRRIEQVLRQQCRRVI